ncbi:hypothetical protein BJY52DRAFT_1265073 [Lactarius psammicola]|nr:hypothetical protein BJY52DRAFT_1265073 [Lactarius psammicola]
MRSSDPTLPSISFVLSQAQPVAPRGKRWNRFGVRRSKSSPSFAPHPPRYPPRLDSEFLTTVDYRFSSPPRAPSRSSFALPKDIFDTDAEIEIVMPSPTESESSTTESTAGCSTTSHTCTYYSQHDSSHAHAKSRSRSHHGHVTAFIHVSPRISDHNAFLSSLSFSVSTRSRFWVLNRRDDVSPSRF